MYRDLPRDQDAVRRRLTRQWVGGQHTAKEQVDGVAAVFSAFWDTLAPMVASLGTRAVMRRTVSEAKRKDRRLAPLEATEGGLDVRELRASLQRTDPNGSREALSGLVDELFRVLYGLLGPSLTPVLREVEAELAKRGTTSHSEKEEP